MIIVHMRRDCDDTATLTMRTTTNYMRWASTVRLLLMNIID